jgi:hypothetical protein
MRPGLPVRRAIRIRLWSHVNFWHYTTEFMTSSSHRRSPTCEHIIFRRYLLNVAFAILGPTNHICLFLSYLSLTKRGLHRITFFPFKPKREFATFQVSIHPTTRASVLIDCQRPPKKQKRNLQNNPPFNIMPSLFANTRISFDRFLDVPQISSYKPSARHTPRIHDDLDEFLSSDLELSFASNMSLNYHQEIPMPSLWILLFPWIYPLPQPFALIHTPEMAVLQSMWLVARAHIQVQIAFLDGTRVTTVLRHLP